MAENSSHVCYRRMWEKLLSCNELVMMDMTAYDEVTHTYIRKKILIWLVYFC